MNVAFTFPSAQLELLREAKPVPAASVQPHPSLESATESPVSMRFACTPESADAERCIRKWQAGEKAAAREFYSLYKNRVYRWAYLKARDPHAAEDLCQEVWQRIHRSLLTYRPGTSPNAWVYTILINTHRSLWRRGQRILETILDCLLDGDESANAPETYSLFDTTPEAALSHKQELEVILSALHEIPEIYRIVVVLRIVEELPIEEVADILDLSEGTVKSRLSRGVKKLRAQLSCSSSSRHGVKR